MKAQGSEQQQQRDGEIVGKSLARYIPEEIVHSIFPNLPAKSLLRFRCVSKQWQSWLSQIKITMQKIISTGSWWYHGQYNPIPQDQFQSINPKTQVKNINIVKSQFLKYKDMKMLGSWEELVLVLIDNLLFLWDPSKGRFKNMLSIHKLVNSEKKLNAMEDNLFWLVASGLYFDPGNGEFRALLALRRSGKVVTIGLESKAQEVIDFPSEIAELEPPYDHDGFTVKSGPVVNKRLHWYVSNPSDLTKQRVLYFDPNAEVKFVDLPLPEGKFRIIGLGVLDGCLCMARRHQNGTYEDHVDVMGMKCYGVKESWTVLFRMSCLERYYVELVPLLYAEKEDVILMREDGVIVAFNTKRRMRKVVCDGSVALVYEETFSKCNRYGRDWSFSDRDSTI